MDELNGLLGDVGEIQDADIILNLIFYIMITLQTDDG